MAAKKKTPARPMANPLHPGLEIYDLNMDSLVTVVDNAPTCRVMIRRTEGRAKIGALR